MGSLENRIIELIGNKRMTARHIASSLGVERKDVNRTLYHSDKFTMNDVIFSAPVWSLKEDIVVAPVSTIDTVILVDLGNIHDCVKKLEPYARAGSTLVVAFADEKTACYPLKDPTLNVSSQSPLARYAKHMTINEAPNVHILQTTSNKRNAADTLVVWVCQCLMGGHRTKYINAPAISKDAEYVIVTKDEGFTYLQDIVEREYDISLSFCSSWDELKMHL